MDMKAFFVARYDPLWHSYLNPVWERLDEAQLRCQPGPTVNSVVWNLWHVARAEDAGINRFVSDRPQVLDDEQWLDQLGIDVRHQGTGQTSAEATDIATKVNLRALRGYSKAVERRTRAIIDSVDPIVLDSALEPATIHRVLFEEGFAHPNAAFLERAYKGWSRGKCLIHFGLTHTYQHVGEIAVLASLQGVDAFGF
jgi:hypothetical protein